MQEGGVRQVGGESVGKQTRPPPQHFHPHYCDSNLLFCVYVLSGTHSLQFLVVIAGDLHT